MGEIKMIVGLGNPGAEYVETRHNVGFRVIDSLSRALDIDVEKKKFGGCFGQGEFRNKKLILLKPWRFMNCSGQVVATAAGFYKLAASDLLVISDDMALPLGWLRIRGAGSAGGHNGLADIIGKLGTGQFARCRIGIGQSNEIDARDYVLSKLAEVEKPLLAEAIERAREAVLCWVDGGVEKAMNEFN